MKKILITVLLSFLIYGTAFAQFGGPFGDLDNLVLDTDCSTYITEGLFCWDTDDEVLYVGNGTTVTSIDVSGSISTHNAATSAHDGKIADVVSLNNKYSCDLATAVTTIGGTSTTLIIDCAEVLASGASVTIPATMTLEFTRGGSVDGVAGGAAETLTINGKIDSGGWQIFGSSLTVEIAGSGDIYSAWWGGPDGTNDEAQIQAAINSLPASTRGNIVLATSTYQIDAKITLPTRAALKGSGGSYSSTGISKFTCNVAGDACIQVGDGATTANSSKIEGINIVAGTATDGTGIFIYYGSKNEIVDCSVTGFITGTGIKISGGTTGSTPSIQNRLDGVYLSNNLTNLHLTGEDGNTTSSADEGVFHNVRIGLAALVNSKGVYVEKGVGNTFNRLTIASTSLASGTTGIYFDDGARTNVYSAKDNIFIGSFLENLAKGIHFEANCSGNIFQDLHAHNVTIKVSDNSGYANIIRSTTGGLGLTTTSSYHNSQTYNNLVRNGEFERWENSANAAPTGWTSVGGGGSFVREATIVRRGTYSAEVVRGGVDASIYYPLSDITYLKGKHVVASAWAYTDTASAVRLRIRDDAGSDYSEFHTGGGGWELLTARRKINSAATYVWIQLSTITTDCTAYWDSVFAAEGYDIPMPYDSYLLDSKRLYNTTTWDPASLGDGAGETKSLTVNGAALGDFVIVTAPYDLQDMTVTGYVQAADTVEIRLQNESGGTVDLGSGAWGVMLFKY